MNISDGRSGRDLVKRNWGRPSIRRHQCLDYWSARTLSLEDCDIQIRLGGCAMQLSRITRITRISIMINYGR